MFGNQKINLPFVRAKELAIFAVYNVSKTDTCDILACLELIDKDFSGKVNVIEFSKVFCRDYHAVFDLLWENYQNVNNKTVDRCIDFYLPEYTPFLSFLLFFLSLHRRDMPKYVYFIWFFIPKILPQQHDPDKHTRSLHKILFSNLEDLVTKLWGTSNPKKALQAAYYKNKL